MFSPATLLPGSSLPALRSPKGEAGSFPRTRESKVIIQGAVAGIYPAQRREVGRQRVSDREKSRKAPPATKKP